MSLETSQLSAINQSEGLLKIGFKIMKIIGLSIPVNPYEFGSTLAAAVPGSEDLHFDCDWLRDFS